MVLKFLVCMAGMFLVLDFHAQDYQKTQIAGKRFTMEYPNGLALTQESTLEDFLLYRLKRKNRHLLQIYIGNQPARLTMSMKPCEIKSDLFGTYPCKEWRQKSKAGKYSGHIVLDMTERFNWPVYGWPGYLHFSYGNLSRKDFEEMSKVVASIKSS